MVLKPAVTGLASTAAIAPESATCRRARHATGENRVERHSAELSFPPSLRCLSAGAAIIPGEPFHEFRSSLPPHIDDIPPAAVQRATESMRTAHRCLSPEVARRRVTAAWSRADGNIHHVTRFVTARRR